MPSSCAAAIIALAILRLRIEPVPTAGPLPTSGTCLSAISGVLPKVTSTAMAWVGSIAKEAVSAPRPPVSSCELSSTVRPIGLRWFSRQ